MTGDKCDNFLLFISFRNIRKGNKQAHAYIRVYIENHVTLSQLSQSVASRMTDMTTFSIIL